MRKVNLPFPGNQKMERSTLGRAIRYLVLLLIILFLTNPNLIPFLPASAKATLSNASYRLLGDLTQISSVLKFNWIALFQLVIMVLVLKILHLLLSAVLARLNPKNGRVSSLITLFGSAQNYVFALVGIFWGLSILGVDVSTMLAGVGVVALVLGFGAESLIADIVTGVFMIFENEYNVGDVIEVGGFRGTVDSIGIRTTCLRDGGDNIKVINNSDMRNLTNLSQRGSTAVCDLPVPYETDLSLVRSLLEEQLLPAFPARHPELFQSAPVFLGVQQLSERTITLRIIATVKEDDRFAAERWLREELKTGMEKNGIGYSCNQAATVRG